jgi:hypothetical protein
MSARELAEWQAFEHVYGPVGVEARIDQAAALIAERITNCFAEAKGKKPTIEDFTPRYGLRLVEERGGDGDAT